MSSYYLPDPTGKDPAYQQINIPAFIYQRNQQLAFDGSPVFASSLRIVTTDGTGTLMIRDADWKVTPADIDQGAMSKAFLEDRNFSDTLVKSVTIISDKVLKQQVALTYQQFYLTSPEQIFDDGSPIEVTPNVIQQLMTGLADTRQQVAKVASPVSPVDAKPALLPFDINGTKSTNLVKNEKQTINTIAGAKIIRLTQGAFFADSLKLSLDGKLLVTGKDYIPVSVSQALTAQSTNKGGIYQYILINGTVSGSVDASYRAVGGEVQLTDVNAVYELMISIKTFLNNGIFITSQTVTESPAFRAMHARLSFLENNVRSILSGAPTYGDATAGTSVVRPVAATDSNFHWYTIANLYQVIGSTDVITSDRFRGRVYLPAAKISLGFTIDVNLTQDRNPASFRTESLVFDPTYTLFGDVSVAAPVYPLVRVVWNQTSQSFSGASLQIGLPLVNLLDRMVVEDLSSSESCWIMDKTNRIQPNTTAGNPSGPRDSGFMLPDGVSIWSSASASSKSRLFVPKFDQGYLVYTGSVVTLRQLNVTSSTASLFNVALPAYFPTSEVTAVIVTLQSPDGTVTYDVEMTTPRLVNNTKTGRLTFSDSTNSLVTITASLRQDANAKPTLSINTVNQGNNFSAMADIVRYVRVKV